MHISLVDFNTGHYAALTPLMKILISGAGMGGSAATLLLRANGHEVVVIDKAPSFSRRGYILSLKFFGLGIMKSLGQNALTCMNRFRLWSGGARGVMPRVT